MKCLPANLSWSNLMDMTFQTEDTTQHREERRNWKYVRILSVMCTENRSCTEDGPNISKQLISVSLLAGRDRGVLPKALPS